MAYASWHTTVTDLQGNVIPNASIYVVNEVTGIAPQLYADRQGTVPLGNPFTAEADGTVSLYVVGGAYRIRASFGAWERTWRYVGIGTAQEVDVEGLASMLQSGFSPVQTLADLNAITPTEFPAGGIVLADPVGANNGYYTNSGSGWVYSRPLPDTFARLYATGGTENNVQATLDAGVNPSAPTVFFIDVTTPNTGPVTLTINGANTGPVLNAAGNPLAAGEWQGRVLFTREGSGDYKILNDPASALSAALSATQAGTARDAAVDAQGFAEDARDDAEAAASNAATSESNAATSASNAATSESNAAGSESNAATSAANALASEQAAEGSASAAASSASNAATSESNAAGSASTATGAANIATQQADRAEEEADRAEAAASSVGNVVAYTPQTPTSAEKAQARTNIGSNDAGNLTTGTVPDERISSTLSPDKAYRRGNILGTVSQSGGVPTGAIIERGSNANGEYVRFADGTQICWAVVTTGGSGPITLSFPSAFVSANGISVTASARDFDGNEKTRIAGLGDVTSSSFKIIAVGNTSDAYSGWPVSMSAHGRWF